MRRLAMLLGAWLRVGAWTAGMRCLPGCVVRGWLLERPVTVRRGTRPSLVGPAAIGDAIDRAGRWVPFSTCMSRALAAQRMLARAGYGSVIELGVRTDADTPLAAHAWLRVGSEVVTGNTSRSRVSDYHHLTSWKQATG